MLLRRVLAVTCVVAGATAAMASVASGGALLPVQVTKVVEGDAPPGAQYVVDITCDQGVPGPEQVVFDGPGSQIVGIPTGNVCTFTETETGGATQTTTAAECVNPPQFCVVEVTSSTSATVTLEPPDTATFDAEVTFVNAYDPPPPPPPPPLPLEAAPAFTG